MSFYIFVGGVLFGVGLTIAWQNELIQDGAKWVWALIKKQRMPK
jgi:Na+/melibiose symporter-like transporter